jgi:hypothetical protein
LNVFCLTKKQVWKFSALLKIAADQVDITSIGFKKRLEPIGKQVRSGGGIMPPL